MPEHMVSSAKYVGLPDAHKTLVPVLSPLCDDTTFTLLQFFTGVRYNGTASYLDGCRAELRAGLEG
jgi:hypothetical protein